MQTQTTSPMLLRGSPRVAWIIPPSGLELLIAGTLHAIARFMMSALFGRSPPTPFARALARRAPLETLPARPDWTRDTATATTGQASSGLQSPSTSSNTSDNDLASKNEPETENNISHIMRLLSPPPSRRSAAAGGPRG